MLLGPWLYLQQQERDIMTSREQYKLIALREKMGELVVNYEDKIADLRVELTMQAEAINERDAALNEARDEIRQLRDDLAGSINKAANPEASYVEGEVVSVQEEE